MAIDEVWEHVPVNEDAERATRGFFERDTFAIWVEDDSDVETGENLITLCVSCHGRTKGNRKDWIKYF